MIFVCTSMHSTAETVLLPCLEVNTTTLAHLHLLSLTVAAVTFSTFCPAIKHVVGLHCHNSFKCLQWAFSKAHYISKVSRLGMHHPCTSWSASCMLPSKRFAVAWLSVFTLLLWCTTRASTLVEHWTQVAVLLGDVHTLQVGKQRNANATVAWNSMNRLSCHVCMAIYYAQFPQKLLLGYKGLVMFSIAGAISGQC